MRVVVLGAGYAGLTLASTLEDELPEAVDIAVVDENGTHVLLHEIHRVVRRPDLAADITLDLDSVLGRATVHEATVESIDTEANVVELDDGYLAFDYAAVCLGSRTAFYDLPGVERHGTPLKRLDHARRIRADFLDVAGAADKNDAADGSDGSDVADGSDGSDVVDGSDGSDVADGSDRRVVVGGGGLSGIQVAGELAALAREEGVADAVEVVVLEQEASLAPSFPENFQWAVHDQLEARDVTVRTGAAVTAADADAITFADGDELPYDQFVWAGGIRGPDGFQAERPVVRTTLRHDDRVFVVGDAGRVIDAEGEAVPASAQAAVRQARVAAGNIATLVDHDRNGEGGFEPRLDRYTFDSPGWLVSVGDGAVAQIGPTVFTGRPAKALKTSVGAGYLSSVGAMANAVDLVRDELGWPTGDDVGDDDGGDEGVGDGGDEGVGDGGDDGHSDEGDGTA